MALIKTKTPETWMQDVIQGWHHLFSTSGMEKMMVVFTEKWNTKGVADLEGKLQISVLDMLSLR